MLVLSRKQGEEIVIGDDIRISVLRSKGGRVRLGITAPLATHIARQEILGTVSSCSPFDTQTPDHDLSFPNPKGDNDVRHTNPPDKPR